MCSSHLKMQVTIQIEFEKKQSLLFNNLKNHYNLLLQLFIFNSKLNSPNLLTPPNLPPIKNINTINITKKSSSILLNRKTQREENQTKECSVLNNKNKIFTIRKITDREKEAAEEKKLKKYIYRGSKYRGVSRNGKTWQVLIMINRNKNYIGNFKSEDEAARAYDEYAMKFHKNKARLNFSHQGFIKYVNKP